MSGARYIAVPGDVFARGPDVRRFEGAYSGRPGYVWYRRLERRPGDKHGRYMKFASWQTWLAGAKFVEHQSDQTVLLPCLSVRQPFADLFFGPDAWGKRFENRSRRFTFTGVLGIHASLAPFRLAPTGEDLMRDAGVPIDGWRSWPRGVIVGLVLVEGCEAAQDLTPEERARWDVCGPYCMRVRPLHKLSAPIAVDGQLGIFSRLVTLDRAVYASAMDAELGMEAVTR